MLSFNYNYCQTCIIICLNTTPGPNIRMVKLIFYTENLIFSDSAKGRVPLKTYMDEKISHAFSLVKDCVYTQVNVSIFSNMIQIDCKTIELKIVFIFQYPDDIPNETREETI